MKKTYIVYIVFLAIFLLCSPATARRNILTANLAISEEFDSNRYETEDDQVDFRQTTVTPGFSFLSGSVHDSVELTYAPEFIYDHDRDTNDIIHEVTFAFDRQLNSRWQMTLSDDLSFMNYDKIDMGPSGERTTQFIRAESYVQDEIVDILFPELGEYDPESDYNYVLSELEERYSYASAEKKNRVDSLLAPADPGRRRHYTNEVSLDFTYDFAESSVFSFGYTLSTLNNKSAGLAEYVEHLPHFSLAYRFNQQWNLDFLYEYDLFDYKDVEDERSHNTEFRLNYNINSHDLLYWSYNFSYTDYDDGTADNFNSQDGGLGWEYDFGSRSHLTAFMGGRYEHREINGDERGYEANATYTRDLRQGNYFFGIEGGFDEYDGSRGWDDLREYLTLNAGINYELFQDVNVDSQFIYERNINWERTVAHTKTIDNDYDAGMGLTYTFMRWYSVSLRYNYHVFNTDGQYRDDFDDHQIFLELTVARDIFHW